MQQRIRRQSPPTKLKKAGGKAAAVDKDVSAFSAWLGKKNTAAPTAETVLTSCAQTEAGNVAWVSTSFALFSSSL
jgi:hypothetical protein